MSGTEEYKVLQTVYIGAPLPVWSYEQVQSSLYISIASGPGGAMLLKRLCIYRGFKYAIIAIVPKSGQQGQC